MNEDWYQSVLLFGHPGSVLKSQLSTADLLLTQVDVLPELGDGVQGSVVLETQTADLQRPRRKGVRCTETQFRLQYLYMTPEKTELLPQYD